MEELSPNQLAPLIKKRLAELQNLLFTKKKSYEKAPQGRIRISQNGGHPEYYLVTERGSLRGKYLPHSQKTLARQLAQKDYDARLIKLLQKEISALQNYMKQTSNGRAIPELYDSLCPARRSLITPAILTNEQYAARWQDVSWTGRPFESDAPYICTARGERVRSKSEVIIADTLFRHNIPYRYEFPLTLKRINPDDIRRDFGRSIPSTPTSSASTRAPVQSSTGNTLASWTTPPTQTMRPANSASTPKTDFSPAAISSSPWKHRPSRLPLRLLKNLSKNSYCNI